MNAGQPRDARVTPTDERRRGRTPRAVIAGLLGVLAVIGVLSSVTAVWAKGVLFDTHVVRTMVDDALRDPEVTEGLGNFIGDQVIAAVPIDELIDDKLPPALGRLAPVLRGGSESLVRGSVVRALRDDSVRELLVRSAEISHRRILHVLEGGSVIDPARIDDDAVKLNLFPVMGRALVMVQERGLLRGIDVPTFSPDGDPAVQRRQMGEALGLVLPDDFGEIVIYRADSVARAGLFVSRAQQALTIFNRSMTVLFAVTAVSAVGTIAVANRRGRASILLSVGVVAAVATGHGLIQTVVDRSPAIAVNPAARRTIRIAVETAARSLLAALTTIVLIGSALVVLGFLIGPRGPFRRRSDAPRSSHAARRFLQRQAGTVTALTIVWFAAAIVLIGLNPLPLAVLSALAVALLVGAWGGARVESVATVDGTEPHDALHESR